MNDRERWLATMHYEPVDHIPDEEFGYWDETFTVWHKQGLPREVKDNTIADRFFCFARREVVPVCVGLLPRFRRRVIREDERHRVIINEEGAEAVIHKDGSSSIPHFVRFPLQTRADWEEFKRRLDPNDPRRYPVDWEWWVRQWKDRTYPLGIHVGSLFGWLRNWMGFEHIAVTIHDDPDWIHEMMEHLTELTIQTIQRALNDVQLDFAAFWEDMAFRSGPMISPKMFKEFMVPRYKRITDVLREHGVDIVYVDCDGDITELVELWLEAGVNTMFPLEVRGGSDPVLIRKRFGKAVRLMGGVDKTKLIEGKEAIRKEIARLEPLVADGGYIPHVDHRVPPDVTYENYLYYLKVKRDAFGIPHPKCWEEQMAAAQAHAPRVAA
ncbi:MAG TPA: hypothetical protein G4O02_11245 [Caldilineae bacterium]|nr:hypothetical protein [Caldilineae bacterium]